MIDIFNSNGTLGFASVILPPHFNKLPCVGLWLESWCLMPLPTRRSVLLIEETGVPGENYRPVASHWQTLSHKVALSTPRHDLNSKSTLVMIDTACIGSCKSNDYAITTTTTSPDVCISVKYDNVVLHHLPAFRLSFTYWLTLRGFPRTSEQMHSGYTSSINNGGKVM